MTSRGSHSIFLSHSSKNDDFVAAVRQRLERRGYNVLEDSDFRAGDVLRDSVKQHMDNAHHVIGVVSKEAVDSGWVKRELRYAQALANQREGYRVIPLRLEPATMTDVRAIFELPEPDPNADLDQWPAELIAIDVGKGAGRVDALLPALMDALEGNVSGHVTAIDTRVPTPLADLRLRLRNPRFELVADDAGVERRRPVAEATLAFFPPDAQTPEKESSEFRFVAPLGKIEEADLKFYLERYHITPFGNFARRAREIEGRFPEWGEELWNVLQPEAEQNADVIAAWRQTAITAQRRFTVEAPLMPRLRGSATDQQKQARAESLEATSQVLALPWELLSDEIGYFFQDGLGVRVRRSLPGGLNAPPLSEEMRRPPLRVLIVCARPETEGVDYIDHRVSVRPLTEALNKLGDLADYDLLPEPTFIAMRDKLREALRAGRPYHIVHFDGHGVYDKKHGLGALVFEHPDSIREGKLGQRKEDVVTADKMGAELRNAGVGLFFLEACQSAQSDQNPEASVAGRLLQSGIGSVAAMSHSVLVETARRFTNVFYPALVRGDRVGEAMLAGQVELYDQPQRGWGWQPRGDSPGRVDRTPLKLQDWFVPVLYQDGQDPVLLVGGPPAERVQEELEKDRALSLGELPPPPDHAFVGRSRELLAAERLLIEQGKQYAVLRGEGGEGKTTMAAELARWLVDTRRMKRAAFVSVENLRDPRAVLWSWGEQLVSGFASRAGDSLQSAEDLLVRSLSEQQTVLVLDNMESILPPPESRQSAAESDTVRDELAAGRVFDRETLDSILQMCRRLLEKSTGTRLLFTSREPLPEDCRFGHRKHQLEVGRLGLREGMELVARVLAEGNEIAAEAVQAERDEEIETLVRTVDGHARSLVLLTPELASRGLAATTEELAKIMAQLEQRYPGQRQRSLFASVELSLRRLPAEVREMIAPMCVCQGGGCLLMLQMVLELDPQKMLEIAALMDQVGLGDLTFLKEEVKGPTDLFLRFDPALGPALLRDLRAREDGETVLATTRSRWVGAYRQLAGFLARQQFRDAHLAAQLTILELPNLMAVLRFMNDRLAEPSDLETTLEPNEIAVDVHATPEIVIDFATGLERLLQYLGRRDSLAEASAVRARANEMHGQIAGGTWTKAAYLAESQQIDRLIDAGRFGEAVAAARALLQRSTCAGDDAYPGADYDHAMTQWRLGGALKGEGKPQEALRSLGEARERFQSLSQSLDREENRASAARATSKCLTEEADCLRNLGQLDAAAGKYEERIERGKKQGDIHGVATGKFQLGTVRLLQERYGDAIELYVEARDTFEELKEPQQVATAWHQVGRVYERLRNLEEAEAAYQKSLVMKVQAGNKPGEAATRNQLGNVYDAMQGRAEEAVIFYRQAAEIYSDPAIADRLSEGRARHNAADTLVKLGRLDEARLEINRALECKSGLGPNAQPWKTWDILCDLETAVGNETAAAEARRKAMDSYESARRQGWQITAGPAARLAQQVTLIMIAKHPRTPPDQIPDELRSQLPQIEQAVRQQLDEAANDASFGANMQALFRAVLAILDGAREPSLADDPALDYADAVEIKLLLEQIP